MALAIRKKEEPIKIERVKVTVYGDAGLGKTTLGMTANNPLILDFDIDHGSNRAAKTADVFYVDQWPDLKNLTRKDYEPYDTIVIDTVGWAINKLGEEIGKTNPNLVIPSTGNFLPQGWQVLSKRWVKFLTTLLGFQKDIVMVAHAQEKQTSTTTVIRLDATGQAKNVVYQCSDQMGYLTKVDGKTQILWNASMSAFGKNSADLPDMRVPSVMVNPHFMADIIESTKKRMTEKQSVKAEEEKIGEEIRISALEREHGDTEFFNTIFAVEQKRKQPNPHIRLMIKTLAREKGCEWSDNEGAFILQQEEESTPHSEEQPVHEETGGEDTAPAPAPAAEEKPQKGLHIGKRKPEEQPAMFKPTTLEGFNEALKAVTGKGVKQAAAKRKKLIEDAEEHGFAYDKKSNTFINLESEAS